MLLFSFPSPSPPSDSPCEIFHDSTLPFFKSPIPHLAPESLVHYSIAFVTLYSGTNSFFHYNLFFPMLQLKKKKFPTLNLFFLSYFTSPFSNLFTCLSPAWGCDCVLLIRISRDQQSAWYTQWTQWVSELGEALGLCQFFSLPRVSFSSPNPSPCPGFSNTTLFCRMFFLSVSAGQFSFS